MKLMKIFFDDETNKEYSVSCLNGIFYIIRIIYTHYCLTNSAIKSSAIFTTWFQILISLLLAILGRNVFKNTPLLNIYSTSKIEFKKLLFAFPACCALMLKYVLSNKAYQYLHITTAQNVLNLYVSFDIILAFLILHRKLNRITIVSSIGVIIGVFLSFYGESSIRIRGFIYGVISCLYGSSYTSLSRRVLKNFENNEASFYFNFFLIFTFVILPFSYYSGDFEVFERPFSFKFWINQIINGIIFFISLSLMLEEKRIGEIDSHTVSYIVTFILLLITALFVNFQFEYFSFLKILGTFIIFVFSSLYEFEFRRFYRTRYPVKRHFPPVQQNLQITTTQIPL